MRLLLIDGHYYVYRSFYAIRDLANSRGEATNAIYGFIKTVRKMIKDTAPDLGAVLWDEGTPKRRTQLQADYKATRAEMPDSMRPQLDFLRRTVPLLGLASIGMQGFEADDLIAAYAGAAHRAGHDVVLATNDKDLYQLVREQCWIYSTNKSDLTSPGDGFALLGMDQVREKWGVAPGKIGDLLALTGDTSDNIPGVAGIGPKTAANLINEYGGLDQILSRLNEIRNERIREKLREGIAQIAQNREMVRLDADLPLPTPIENMGISPRWDELIAAMEACEFKGLTAEIKKDAAYFREPRTVAPEKGSTQQGMLF